MFEKIRIRLIRLLPHAIAVVVLFITTASLAQEEQDTTYHVYPYLSRACGMNSLYAMLKLHDIDRSHEEMKNAVPVGAHGTSLLELSRAADRLGVETNVFKGSIENLKRRSYRGIVVLVHVDSKERMLQSIASPSGDVEMGHFLTLVGWDDSAQRIVAIDGTRGHIRRFSMNRFEAVWTGYFLALTENYQAADDRIWTVRHAIYAAPTSLILVVAILAFCGRLGLLQSHHNMKNRQER